MNKVILRNGNYALIDRDNEYVVACGYDETQPENQKWEHGVYFTHWNQSEFKKTRMLSNAIDCFRSKVEENYISRSRLEELATQFKDGLIEDDKESAMEYFDEVCEMSDEEKEWFGISESEDEEDE